MKTAQILTKPNLTPLTNEEWEAYQKLIIHNGFWPATSLAGRPWFAGMLKTLVAKGLAAETEGGYQALRPWA